MSCQHDTRWRDVILALITALQSPSQMPNENPCCRSGKMRSDESSVERKVRERSAKQCELLRTDARGYCVMSDFKLYRISSRRCAATEIFGDAR